MTTLSLRFKMLLRRIISFVYDCLLLLGILFIVGSFGLYLNHGEALQNAFISNSLVIITGYIFFAWFWTHGKQTLGMRAWKLEISDENMQTITWKTAFIRLLVASATLGSSLLWILIDREGRAVHDIVSKTRIDYQPKNTAE